MKRSAIFLASAMMCCGLAAAQTASSKHSGRPATGNAGPSKSAPADTRATKPPLPELPKLDNLELAKEEIMPLKPAEVLELKGELDASRRAANTDIGTPPRPSSGSVAVDLSPGSSPPVVRLAPGHVTSLSFVDVTGAPWPITHIINGNPKNFDIKTPEKDSNTATIAALGFYSVGNAAVMLEGLPAPVTVTLVGGQKEVDYRLDMRIPRRGPHATAQQVTRTSLPELNGEFMNILDGVVPKGAIPLKVSGEGQAWMLNGNVVFRTSRALISPAWISKYQSSDGTLVYELPFAPVLLTTVNGSISEVRISQ
jgi:intracellular multiplication protein IcmK